MTSTVQDPHGVLGIPRGASQQEIRRIYRRLAKKYHPDLNPDDPQAEQRFKQIQGAYDALVSGTPHQRIRDTDVNPMAAPAGSALSHPFIWFYQALRASERFRTRKQAASAGDEHQAASHGATSGDSPAQ